MAPQTYYELAKWDGSLEPPRTLATPRRMLDTQTPDLQDNTPKYLHGGPAMLEHAEPQDELHTVRAMDALLSHSGVCQQPSHRLLDSKTDVAVAETRGGGDNILLIGRNSSSYDHSMQASTSYPTTSHDETEIFDSLANTNKIYEDTSVFVAGRTTPITDVPLRAEWHLKPGGSPGSSITMPMTQLEMSLFKKDSISSTNADDKASGQSFMGDGQTRESIPGHSMRADTTLNDGNLLPTVKGEERLRNLTEKNGALAHAIPSTLVRFPVRASSEQDQTEIYRSPTTMCTLHAIEFDDDVSVVPETPGSSPTQSVQNTPQTSPPSPLYSSSQSRSGQLRTPELGREPSVSDSTLMGSIAPVPESSQLSNLASEHSRNTVGNELSKASAPFRCVERGEIVPESPLSSLTTLPTPRKARIGSGSEKRLASPPHTAYVYLPCLRPSMKIWYKSLEVVMAQPQKQRPAPPRSLTRQQLPPIPGAREIKRKRTPSGSSESSDNARPLKKVASHKLQTGQRNIFVQNLDDTCAPEMYLDVPCPPGSERDKLRRHFPYVQADIDTVCEDHLIDDMIEESLLDDVLATACRHILAPVAERARALDRQRLPALQYPVDDPTQETDDKAHGEAADFGMHTSIADGTRSSPPTPQPISRPVSAQAVLGLQGTQECNSYAPLLSSPARAPLSKDSALETTSSELQYILSAGQPSPFTVGSHLSNGSMSTLPHSSPVDEGAAHPIIQTSGLFSFAFSQASMLHARHGGDAFIAGQLELQDLLMTWDHDAPALRSTTVDEENRWTQEHLGDSHTRFHFDDPIDMSDYGATTDLNATIDPSLLAGPSKSPSALPQSSPVHAAKSCGLYDMDICKSVPSSAPSPSMSSSPLLPTSAVDNNFSDSGHVRASSRGQAKRKGASKADMKGKSKETSPVNLISTGTLAHSSRGKGNGKGRARGQPAGWPREYFGWAPDVNRVASELSENHVVEGKRSRKPTARLRDLGSHVNTQDKNGSSDEGDNVTPVPTDIIPGGARANSRATDNRRVTPRPVKRTGSYKSKERSILSAVQEADSDKLTANMRLLVELSTYCHQCRNKNRYEKMRCTKIKNGGVPCGLMFCHKCILLRYPDIQFDAFATVFACPKCSDYCNCSSCCARRGEKYVSTRGKKLDVVPSACGVLECIATPQAKQASSESFSLEHRRRTTSSMRTPTPSSAHTKFPAGSHSEDVPLHPSMHLPEGTIWGAVYDVTDGQRLGRGIVVNETSIAPRQPVLANVTAPRMKPKFSKFIGKPRREWPPSACAPPEDKSSHSFIGSRHAIYTWHRERCLFGDLTPEPSEDEVDNEGASPGSDSTAPFPLTELQFIMADVLGRQTAANAS